MALPACLVLAALSLLAPATPTTDPWGWIVWGREVAHLDLSTDVGGSPSWKPLPVLLTTVLSLAGDLAPDLWLWLARAACLYALVVAFRLARRVAGRAAGVVAALALVLTAGFARAAAHGYSEGLVQTLLLLATERHLDGRRRATFCLLFLAGLARPEVWLFLGLYAVHLWRSDPDARRLVAGLLVAVPVLWIGVDWWGSGELFHASGTARAVDANLVWYELLGELPRAVGVPALVLAVVACVAAVREGGRSAGAIGARRLLAAGSPQRPVALVAACVLAWIALLCLLVTLGWPGSPRFLVPAVALVCVLAGVGAVRAVEVARIAPAARLAVAALLLLGASPGLAAQAEGGADDLRSAERRADLETELREALHAAGESRLRRCGAYALPAELTWVEGAVAWELDTRLGNVYGLPRTEGLPAALAIDGPLLAFDGGRGKTGPPPADPLLTYPLPAGSLDCLTVLAPLPGPPHVLGAAGAQVRMLARKSRWRVWAIRLPADPGRL